MTPDEKRKYHRDYNRVWRARNPELQAEYAKTFKENHPDYRDDPASRQSSADRRSVLLFNLKMRVQRSLGGICCRCGFSDSRALQIDHVDGEGSEDRRGIYRGKFLNKVLAASTGYQLLCANCNWIKRFENEEHFHPERGRLYLALPVLREYALNGTVPTELPKPERSRRS